MSSFYKIGKTKSNNCKVPFFASKIISNCFGRIHFRLWAWSMAGKLTFPIAFPPLIFPAWATEVEQFTRIAREKSPHRSGRDKGRNRIRRWKKSTCTTWSWRPTFFFIENFVLPIKQQRSTKCSIFDYEAALIHGNYKHFQQILWKCTFLVFRPDYCCSLSLSRGCLLLSCLGSSLFLFWQCRSWIQKSLHLDRQKANWLNKSSKRGFHGSPRNCGPSALA